MERLLTAVLLFISLIWPKPALAVVIAQQNQNWFNLLTVWQVIQELGDNLSGTADKFTFRIATTRTNSDQFDFTVPNSRIYDKFDNSSFGSCAVTGTSPIDRLEGLIFTTAGVPLGFEDVTIDFSCRNYSFIPGHKYLIYITNANFPNALTNSIFFAAANYNQGESDLFTGGGVRYANANRYDYSNNSGSCDPVKYKWGNTNPWRNGCQVWKTPKDDLYFILTNTSLPPKTPVIFIPGIGGSEFKAAQDIVWSADNGHNGTYSHAYTANEKIWVNQDEAVKLGDDDYFDVLRLKSDGQTSEAALSLTGELTAFGYGEIDSFFTEMGYEKGKNFFVFPYDWRKDVRTTQADLDNLIETAKQKTGLSKVNIVVHSMGGLVAHNYIADSAKAGKVNKLIELGVPHLGTVYALKTLMYGTWLARDLYIIKLGIIPNEVKDVFRNLPSAFQLLPSNKYYNLYSNSETDSPYPFRDDSDIDKNKTVGALNYDQIKDLLSNLSHNMTAFGLGEQFHNSIDSILNQPNGVKLYNIVGSAQPTLGQIRETYWIAWPVNLIPKTEEIFINGDDTVPLYSASLKKDGLDLSGGAKIYYVEQKHSDLVSKNGLAMQTVRKILEDDNSLPVEVKSDKYTLDGSHISADGDIDLDLYDENGNHTGLNDKGEIEEKIPHTFYSTSKKTKNVFVKKKSPKVTVKVKSSSKKQSTNIRIRHYQTDSITKTITYKDVPINDATPVAFPVDPSTDTPSIILADNNNISPIEVSGNYSLDQTAPKTSVEISGDKNSSGIFTGPVKVTLTGNDPESGILRIEYSLDNGKTIQVYSEPFTIATPGKNTILIKAIDKLGNEEIPQEITIEIAASPSPTPTPTTSPSQNTVTPNATERSSDSTNTFYSGSSGSSGQNNSAVSANTVNTPDTVPQGLLRDGNLTSQGILGVSFKNPNHISDQINVGNILGTEKKINSAITSANPTKQTFASLLIVTFGGIVVASLGLFITFIKPTPK